MLSLPSEIIEIIMPFAQICSTRIWDWAQVPTIGAILAPGKRTVTAVLRVMGLKDDQQYQNYQRVLNRAKWSGLHVLVWRHLWTNARFTKLPTPTGFVEIPTSVLHGLVGTLCYAT